MVLKQVRTDNEIARRLGRRVAELQNAELQNAESQNAESQDNELHDTESQRPDLLHDDVLDDESHAAPAPRRERISLQERLEGIRRREANAVVRARVKVRTQRLLIAFAACLVAIGAVAFFVSQKPIGFVISGRSAAPEQSYPGEWVGSPAAIDFSEGSRVDVLEGAGTRVTQLDRDGASLLLEKGRLHVRIVPRAGNNWTINAGPFAVRVIGTEFDMTWDAVQEALTVSMVSGQVAIEGPCVDEERRALSAPRAATFSCREVTGDNIVPAAVSPALAPSLAVASPESPSAPTSAPVASAIPHLAWKAQLRAGKAKEAYAELDRAGIEGALTHASGDELVELGSAARLSGNGDAARKLYLAARERFQHSDAAAIGAYHLGRMAFDGARAWADAEQWFAVYLSERPSGALAPEALGRSIECAVKRGDTARAKQLAARYLQSYPQGAHAGLASEVSREDR
jgi:transmembrane sensor